MRRIEFLIVTLVVLVNSIPFAAHADTPQKWALLIGIDHYEDRNRINDLSSGSNDARALRKALIEAAGVPEVHIVLLVTDDKEHLPTRTNILRELSILATNAKGGDTVFVFFSGHGMEIAGKPYLLPSDADAIDTGTFTDTSIETAKFEERLKMVSAKLLILAFDMCRNTPLKNSRDALTKGPPLSLAQVRGLDFALPIDKTAKTGPQAVAVLYSCSTGERSFEWTSKQRGYFSYYLEEGLRGKAADKDGSVRLMGLSGYLKEKVAAAVQANENQPQTPLLKLEGAITASQIALTGISTPATTIAEVKSKIVDSRARLQLTLEPKDAVVLVDGTKRTANPVVLDLGGAKEKIVEVSVTANGYKSSVQKVTLKPGTIVSLPITLTPKSSTTGMPTLRTNPIDGSQTVLIPAGPFLMGDDDLTNWNPTHSHRLTIRLSAYCIDTNLVTVERYEKFCRAKGLVMPGPPGYNPGWSRKNLPMVNVTWDEARRYCQWAGGDLPTEAQWEKAARGTNGQKYPWGNTFNQANLLCSVKVPGDANGAMPIGSFPQGKSPFGCLDMAGNVFQWCRDWYDEGFWTSITGDVLDPVNESRGAKTQHSSRGGSWYYPQSIDCFRSGSRTWTDENLRGDGFGFRVAYPAGIKVSETTEVNATFHPPLTLKAYQQQMVTVPAGTFSMGDANVPDATPVHNVSLSSYKIGKTPVTVGMYEEYCRASGHEMPPAPSFNANWTKKDHPIVNVTWAEATEYCKWAAMDLPSEAEWEKAAGWDTDRQQVQKYPWGDTWDTTRLWHPDNDSLKEGGTTTVGRFASGASPYGCLDMMGNPLQWCRDWHAVDFYNIPEARERNSVNVTYGDQQYRILRGGTWFNGTVRTVTWRHKGPPNDRDNFNGFRMVFRIED